jgi:uncharacterized protein YbjT (DUF2867 family)
VDVHLPGVDAAARDQHGSVGGDTAVEVDGHLGHAAAVGDGEDTAVLHMSVMAARAASTSAFGTPKPRNWCVRSSNITAAVTG